MPFPRNLGLRAVIEVESKSDRSCGIFCACLMELPGSMPHLAASSKQLACPIVDASFMPAPAHLQLPVELDLAQCQVHELEPGQSC